MQKQTPIRMLLLRSIGDDYPAHLGTLIITWAGETKCIQLINFTKSTSIDFTNSTSTSTDSRSQPQPHRRFKPRKSKKTAITSYIAQNPPHSRSCRPVCHSSTATLVKLKPLCLETIVLLSQDYNSSFCLKTTNRLSQLYPKHDHDASPFVPLAAFFMTDFINALPRFGSTRQKQHLTTIEALSARSDLPCNLFSLLMVSKSRVHPYTLILAESCLSRCFAARCSCQIQLSPPNRQHQVLRSDCFR